MENFRNRINIKLASNKKDYLKGISKPDYKSQKIYDFNNDKIFFDFSNYSTQSKYCDDGNKLVVGKMKDKTGDVAIEEFVELKPKMDWFLVGDNSKHKKQKV